MIFRFFLKFCQLFYFSWKTVFILELLSKNIIKQTLKTLYKITQNTLNFFKKKKTCFQNNFSVKFIKYIF